MLKTILLLFSLLSVNQIYAQLLDCSLGIDEAVICNTNAANIYVENTQIGVDYYLLDSTGNRIQGPLAGNGTVLAIPLDSMPSSPYYTVEAIARGASLELHNSINIGNDNRTINQAISFSVKVKISSPTNGARLFQKSFGNNSYYMDVNPTGQVSIQFFETSGNYWNSGYSINSINDNQWHHVVGVIDLINGVSSVYVDGLVSSSNTNITGDSLANNAVIVVGHRIEGYLDEVTIWNRALTASEIPTLMSTCLTGTETGIVGHFKIDEGFGNTLADSSPLGLDGSFWLEYPDSWQDDYMLNCGTDTFHLSDTITIPTTSPSILPSSLSLSDSIICAGDSTTVNVDNPVAGIYYFLVNSTNNQAVDGPYQATTSSLAFNTHAIYNPTTYTVLAEQQYKNAIYFNGIDNYITTSIINRGINAFELSLATWVKMDSSTSHQSIFTSEAVNLYIDDEGKVNMRTLMEYFMGPILPVAARSNRRVDDNKWHSIIGIISNYNRNIKIYIDGVLEGTYNLATNDNFANYIDIRSYIGVTSITSTPIGYYKGFIADLAFFNTAISPLQIQQYQNNSFEGNEANLVYYYTFDAIVGNTIVDKSTISNGVLTNIDLDSAWGYQFIPHGNSVCQVNASSNTVSVDILPIGSSSETIPLCSGVDYTFPDGSTFYAINKDTLYTSILTSSVNGCDSLVHTIIDIEPNLQVSLNSNTLSVNQPLANYQWLDCSANFAPITGATNQSFTPNVDGNYAVEVSLNGCIDTSTCTAVVVNSIQQRVVESIQIYPNPTKDILYFETSTTIEGIQIFNSNGVLLKSHLNNNLRQLSVANLPQGLYFLEIKTALGLLQHRFVKQ